jgi:hypothetical protein
MIVRVGGASRKFLIVNRMETNPLFNAYEAYVVHDKFVSSTPLVLVAFVNDNGDAPQNLHKELNNLLWMKQKNIVVDRAHSIVVYGHIP